MNPRAMAAIGLAAYLLGIIAIAPASLIDAGLQVWADGRLRLVDARGTLWSGSGRIEFRDPAGNRGVAEGLAWRLVPASLLSGRLDYVVDMSRAPRPFPVRISRAGLELADAEVALPAAVFGLVLPRLAPLGLSGNALLQITTISISPERFQGKATLKWREAGSALTPIAPLGDYELRLDAEAAGVRLSLHTLAGPLQLDGGGFWVEGGAGSFQVLAQVPLQYRQQLGPLLGLVAVEHSAGNFTLNL